MRKSILIVLLFFTNLSDASEYGKVCIGPVEESDRYKIEINKSKKYGLSEEVQVCFNELSITAASEVKIYRSNERVQELEISFLAGYKELACILFDKKSETLQVNMRGVNEDHCDF